MSVWTDVVGQERAVAALDAAARSARALVRARRASSAAGSGQLEIGRASCRERV